MENLYADSIRTRSGIYFDVFNPQPDMFNIEDIAHALSRQCRFGGHVKDFYSVAEHSIFCYMHVPPELQLTALLHDLSEAYLMDLPTPIKKRFPFYKEVEDGIMKAAAEKFGFIYPLPEEIKIIDEYALQREWEILMIDENPNDLKLTSLPKDEVKEEFLRSFYKCCKYNGKG